MATVQAVRMADTIGQNLGVLMQSAYWQQRPILSYTTRLYAASDSQIAGINHWHGIDQAPTDALFRGAVVKDVEGGAALIGNAVNLYRAGHQFVTYTFEANMDATRKAMAAARIQHALYWVADWNLDEAAALSYLAAHPDVMAVQWASPTSNPGLIVPGTSLTIRQANVDLSVGRLSYWMPGKPAPAPAHGAKGLWEANVSHTPDNGGWAVEPLHGTGVELATMNLTDYAVHAIDLKTGQHRVKGIDRVTGAALLR